MSRRSTVAWAASARRRTSASAERSAKESRHAAAGLDVGDDASTSLRITAMHQHVRTGLPELASDEPADPVCRTGDQCRLSAQLFHRRSPHGARRARLLWDAGSSKSSFSETKTIAAGAVGRQKTKGRARLTAVLLKVGPEVRIPLPPAASLQTLGLSRDE